MATQASDARVDAAAPPSNDVGDDDDDVGESVAVERHDFLFKFLLLGDSQSGKTKLLTR
jgi:hypothetical protein